MPLRTHHHGLNKEKHTAPLVHKQDEKNGWKLVKDLLPKLAKESKNGTLPSIEPSPLPKRCVQLPPITS